MFLEVGDLGGVIVLMFLILFGPPLLFLIIGLVLFSRQKKKAGKVFCILAGVYLLIGLGICGALMTGF